LSEPSPTARSSRLFGSALACGMLMGVLSAGFEVLVYHLSRPLYSRGDYTSILLLSFCVSCMSDVILFSSVALYRRSWKLVGKAILWSLGMVLCSWLAHIFSTVIMNSMLRTSGFLAINLIMGCIPITIISSLHGIGAASLYGYPRFRWRFVGCASLVGLLYFAQYAFIYATMGSEGMQADMEALSTMGSLITGPLMGAALAWPVEKLERDGSAVLQVVASDG
jgi:hypothetical protein